MSGLHDTCRARLVAWAMRCTDGLIPPCPDCVAVFLDDAALRDEVNRVAKAPLPTAHEEVGA